MSEPEQQVQEASFRDARLIGSLSEALKRTLTRPWTLMEICGGQTHAFLRFGLEQLLPEALTLVHGPGCPVCVTPRGLIDQALSLASRKDITLCSFGDMVRVPGTHTDLQTVRARGGDVRIVYSPLDAVTLARKQPERQVVFFAVGFETTAPAVALAVVQARALNLQNFSILVSHVLVPPAIEAILEGRENRIQGFLAAGHVCTIMGVEAYRPLATRFSVPIVVTGFEPVDLMGGILAVVRQLEEGRAEVENAYGRVAPTDGNRRAQALLQEVFQLQDRAWRGLGVIPSSGLGLAPAWRFFDASERFGLQETLLDSDRDAAGVCQAGLVLQGLLQPNLCPAFGRDCTPERPLGAPMVSAEGACAAYFRYRPQEEIQNP